MKHPPFLFFLPFCSLSKRDGVPVVEGEESDPFDPARLALPPGNCPSRGKRLPRARRGEWFLKGPVPWPWIEAAAGLPGQALYVGLVAWREPGSRHSLSVPVNLSRLKMGRGAAARGLKALETAGLVSVEYRAGRPTLVTILSPGNASNSTEDRT